VLAFDLRPQTRIARFAIRIARRLCNRTSWTPWRLVLLVPGLPTLEVVTFVSRRRHRVTQRRLSASDKILAPATRFSAIMPAARRKLKRVQQFDICH
jgi:hypothetical protein